MLLFQRGKLSDVMHVDETFAKVAPIAVLELEITNPALKAIPSRTIQASARITLVSVHENFRYRPVVIIVAGGQLFREDRCL
jgi:hypothetical protein